MPLWVFARGFLYAGSLYAGSLHAGSLHAGSCTRVLHGSFKDEDWYWIYLVNSKKKNQEWQYLPDQLQRHEHKGRGEIIILNNNEQLHMRKSIVIKTRDNVPTCQRR